MLILLNVDKAKPLHALPLTNNSKQTVNGETVPDSKFSDRAVQTSATQSPKNCLSRSDQSPQYTPKVSSSGYPSSGKEAA